MLSSLPGVERDLPSRPASATARTTSSVAIAIERRDLDRHHVLDLDEAAPEPVRQRAPAHRGLQIEAEQRDRFGDRAAVLDQLRIRRARERAEAEQPDVDSRGRARRAPRRTAWRVAPTHAGHPQIAGSAAALPLGDRLRRQLEHRAVQSDLGFRMANCVVCTPTATPPAPGVEVVARERALPPLVELARRGERQRMRRDHHARRDACASASDAQNFPSRDLEVRRLVERAAALLDPLGDPLDHLLDAHVGRPEQRLHARRVAQQRRRRFAPVEARLDAPALPELLGEPAHRHRGPPVTLSTSGGELQRAERPERDRVRVALPDHVHPSHAPRSTGSPARTRSAMSRARRTAARSHS